MKERHGRRKEKGKMIRGSVQKSGHQKTGEARGAETESTILVRDGYGGKKGLSCNVKGGVTHRSRGGKRDFAHKRKTHGRFSQTID